MSKINLTALLFIFLLHFAHFNSQATVISTTVVSVVVSVTVESVVVSAAVASVVVSAAVASVVVSVTVASVVVSVTVASVFVSAAVVSVVASSVDDASAIETSISVSLAGFKSTGITSIGMLVTV